MGLKELTRSFPWGRYSKQLQKKITRLRSAGCFSKKESEERGMFFSEGSVGEASEGNELHLYWLVDPEDGVIVDAKFQAFGQSALLGAAEVACELVIGKNYDQARRISTDLIDVQLKDQSDQSAFPEETFVHLNMVLEAVEAAAENCQGLPLPSSYEAPPVSQTIEGTGEYPGWQQLSIEQKITVVKELIEREVQPYIALDGGGIEVINLVGNELVIQYQGACTSCYSAVGATLSYIQQVIRANIHPEIKVVPSFPSGSALDGVTN